MSGMAVIASPTQYKALLSGRGIIVADDDPRGWAIAIAYYLANPQAARDDAKNLRDYISQQFDVSVHSRELDRIYQEGS